MINLLLFIWQLPQNILGLILIKALKAEKDCRSPSYINYWYFTPKGWFGKIMSGVSLGQYIILKTHGQTTIRHEYGHSRQSIYLGPLYLVVIGVPSVCGNLLLRLRWLQKKLQEKSIALDKWYYSLPWERWADKLGGVIRSWHTEER